MHDVCIADVYQKVITLAQDGGKTFNAELFFNLGRRQVREEVCKTYRGKRKIQLFDDFVKRIDSDNALETLDLIKNTLGNNEARSSLHLAKLLLRAGIGTNQTSDAAWLVLAIPNSKHFTRVVDALAGKNVSTYLHVLIMRECTMITSN